MGMDVSELLEACYAPSRKDEQWASGAVEGFRAAFRFFDEVAMFVATCDAVTDQVTPTLMVAPSAWGGFLDGMRTTPLRDARPYMYPAKPVTPLGDAGKLAPSIWASWRQYRAAAGLDRGVAIVVHPQPTIALFVFGAGGPELSADRKARTALTRAALHIESGYRMRMQRGAVRAVIGADGKVLDGELTGGERTTFSTATRAAEVARSSRDLGLWTALVSGHISVVPRMYGARRVYELVENARAARAVRALSRREVDVLELAATGLSNKLCSYALGLSPATISTTLGNAARKLGALRQLELLRVAALLSRDPRADTNDETLTAAEREILELVRQGLSNAEIAAHRRRSVRTIANQVARLLEKTRRPSRRALVAS